MHMNIITCKMEGHFDSNNIHVCIVTQLCDRFYNFYLSKFNYLNIYQW